MSAPWMKFYPRDWRGDQALRAVSIAARGLWIECLCIMHEAKPYGQLLLNGEPVEGDALARMAGVSVDEVHSLLGELRQAGVLSVTRNGVIFSRRMTKDHARAQKGKTAVQKRWKPQEQGTPQAPDTIEKSGAPNRPPNREPITQKPEARSQKEKREEINISSPKKASGCRLSADWVLPDDLEAWALSQGLTLPRVQHEAEKFRDYWSAQAGARGVKLDWAAIWRVWIRNVTGPRPELMPISGGKPHARGDQPARYPQDRHARALGGVVDAFGAVIAAQPGRCGDLGNGD